MIDKPSQYARRGRDTRGGAPCTPLLSIQAVADLLGVSTKTVRRLIAGGDLAAHRIGGSLRISEEDLRAYLAATARRARTAPKARLPAPDYCN